MENNKDFVVGVVTWVFQEMVSTESRYVFYAYDADTMPMKWFTTWKTNKEKHIEVAKKLYPDVDVVLDNYLIARDYDVSV